MFRLPFLVLVSLAIAFTGGIWSSTMALRATAGFGALTLGPWSAYPEIQTANADPYARARRAEEGKLLLGRAEGLVFVAETDSAGLPLLGRCTYEIEGSVPTARFWTFRVTDKAGRPAPALPFTPSSLQSWLLLHRPDGSFRATIGGAPATGNWVSVAPRAHVRFVITLIDTPTAASVGLTGADMPKIVRKGCVDA